MSEPVRIHLISGGKYHDFDLARLVLLNLMAEDDRIRVRCAADFRDVGDLAGFAAVVLYTCDLMPSESEAQALADFVAAGGRLLALHGANAGLEFTDGPEIVASGVRIPGLVKPTAESVAPAFMELLGSRFVAHLSAQTMHIHVEDPDHPITRGLDDFTVTDEPYIAAPLCNYRTLLTARYKGEAPGYLLGQWDDDPPRPQLYVRSFGGGEVAYSPLGHACGRFDARPLMDEAPVVRGPWDEAAFQELLRRCIAWLAEAR
jgi:type 1 glutamine amidotransferase